MVGEKFVLKEKIGKGSFGQIYSGYNKETRGLVAIKLVNVSSHPLRSQQRRSRSSCFEKPRSTRSSREEVSLAR